MQGHGDSHHGSKAVATACLGWLEASGVMIYLDLRKVYNALDWGQCLEILSGYRGTPNLLCLQKKFWANVTMVCHTGEN